MKRIKLFTVLRIICAVISAALVAACIFIFIYFGTFEGFLTIMAAAIFLLLMLMFKYLQEDAQRRYDEKISAEAPAAEIPEADAPAEEHPEEE